ncbi:hypothetical protein HYQ44_011935 [Verticillium longisporum]|nr:hypothetical protein HYQ44_011935 [Verticillium longisporum]
MGVKLLCDETGSRLLMMGDRGRITVKHVSFKLSIEAMHAGRDRDPEAEAEDKVEDEKVVGAEEEAPEATNDEWAAAPAGFTGATGNWDGTTDEWGATNTAAPAAPPAAGSSTEWGGEATKAEW